MPTDVTREEVQKLIQEGAQIVEPLTEDEYVEEHLPGAINIPQNRLTPEATAGLDKNTPTIVYCFDTD